MRVQSAKAKGRRLQQWFRDLLIEKLDIHPEDIESRSMGAGGEDLIMARAAREKFPYSIECKNQESVNVWKAFEQASENSGNFLSSSTCFFCQFSATLIPNPESSSTNSGIPPLAEYKIGNPHAIASNTAVGQLS